MDKMNTVNHTLSLLVLITFKVNTPLVKVKKKPLNVLKNVTLITKVLLTVKISTKVTIVTC